MKSNKQKRYTLKFAIMFGVLVVLFFISFLIGRYAITPKTVIDIIFSRFLPIEPYWEETLGIVVLQVRLPRIILAILVGGALSVAGASYQVLFKNPMVSPDILGVSAGAGFGAALAMLYGSTWWEVQVAAFVFGIIAVAAAYLIGRTFGDQSITVLILAGVVVSSLFQALLSIIKTLADTENALPSITFWLMGSLGRGTNKDVLIILPALILSLGLLFIFRHQIDVLSAGEDTALTMGVNVPVVKVVVVASATLMTVLAVSIAGIVGWVGMVVPHIARVFTGSSYPRLLIASFLIGGSFLLTIDNVIRGIPGVELPLGVLTALVGTPVFVMLLSRLKKGWSS